MEGGVFGPDELRHIAAAFDALVKDLGLTDQNDPAPAIEGGKHARR
jgi:hypothetical protein